MTEDEKAVVEDLYEEYNICSNWTWNDKTIDDSVETDLDENGAFIIEFKSGRKFKITAKEIV